ncbi:hypothetical protein M5X17_31365 [Paenibacillus alvei]|uniref:hypothetical protein n=1 Tax=Paenibacillus alvei TaxID=44250 RepID=UPI002281DEBC|nr:hypothetical protein [Paenibacillus alvei]MCY9738194.1 hypothetical protein [Paenibacillus alvei]
MEQKILDYLSNISVNLENLTNKVENLTDDMQLLKSDMKQVKETVSKLDNRVEAIATYVEQSHRAALETHEDVKILMERKSSNMDEELLRRNHAADITLMSLSNRLDAIENKLNN